jgi:hypothetical protein
MSSRKRLVVRLGVALLCVGLGLVPQSGGRAESAAAAVVATATVAVREQASGISSVNMSLIEQTPSSRRIGEVLAQLPTDRKLTPGYLPDGWSAEQKGKQVRAWGPPANAVNMRFNMDGNFASDYIGKPASLQGRFNGNLDDPIKLTIGSLPKLDPTAGLEGILTLPPQAVPGQPMLVGVAPGYRDGSWQLNTTGGVIPLIAQEDLRDIETSSTLIPDVLRRLRESGGLDSLLSRPAPRPFITAYPTTGDVTGVRFINRWHELEVDAPVEIKPVTAPTGSRWLGGGSALTFAGQAACVSGRFPTFGDAYGLMLDGKTELQPWGASPTSVMLGIPDNTAAGSHTISTPDGSSKITIGVVTVEGSLDQNKLWRGESTTMRLRVVGTDEKFPLVVVNRSPDVISMDGGARQVVMTPGGADNAVTRSVTGIHRGNFTILYSVNSPGCGG